MFAWPGISLVPAPRPIDSTVIAGKGPNRSATVATIAAPVGVVSSISTGESASGMPLSNSAVPGAGSGIRPWAAITEPRPGGIGAGLEPVDAQQVEPDGGADDVDDRIDRADLVEVDLLHVHAVRVGLGLAELGEDLLGQLGLPRRQRGLVDHRLDVVQVAVGVLVRGDDLRIGGPEAAAADGLEGQLEVEPERPRRPEIARGSTPASTRAPSVMSPEMPLKQSKYAMRTAKPLSPPGPGVRRL